MCAWTIVLPFFLYRMHVHVPIPKPMSQQLQTFCSSLMVFPFILYTLAIPHLSYMLSPSPLFWIAETCTSFYIPPFLFRIDSGKPHCCLVPSCVRLHSPTIFFLLWSTFGALRHSHISQWLLCFYVLHDRVLYQFLEVPILFPSPLYQVLLTRFMIPLLFYRRFIAGLTHVSRIIN